jgi:hypothetical protein
MPIAEFAALRGIAERNQSTGVRSYSALISVRALACCASMNGRTVASRGFLEACADTWQAFADVAPTLADSHAVVRRAINGELSEQMALVPELGSTLIHFAYARRLRPGEGPALHSATTAKDCLSVLWESAPDVVEVYHALCDYTHPAAPSLFRFAGESADPDTLTFDPNAGPHKRSRF